jgi:hypothetical protein
VRFGYLRILREVRRDWTVWLSRRADRLLRPRIDAKGTDRIRNATGDAWSCLPGVVPPGVIAFGAGAGTVVACENAGALMQLIPKANSAIFLMLGVSSSCSLLKAKPISVTLCSCLS